MRRGIAIAAVTSMLALVPSANRAIAQPQRRQADECATKSARTLFGSTERPQLSVRRAGAEVFKLLLVPNLIVSVCYDELGPDGELTGDLVIRMSPGVGAVGSPMVMTIADAAVVR
jgi:hypothetical protein